MVHIRNIMEITAPQYQFKFKSMKTTPYFLLMMMKISTLNGEPFFSNENNSYCVCKQDTGVWWIGNCEDKGKDSGFAYMIDCKCPWPR